MIKKKLKSGVEVVVKPLVASQAARLSVMMAKNEADAVEIIREVYVNGEKLNIDDIVITPQEYLELVEEAITMNYGESVKEGE